MRSELAKAKTDVKNFGKVSEGALDAFGSALGVNVGKIKEVSSAIQGMGQKMTQSSSEAVKGLGSMLKGVNALSAGIAGVGVAALIAGFKSLKAEAENFSNTIDGLNMKMAQEAYISTLKQALHDATGTIGQETAEKINDLEKKWTGFWGKTKTAAVTAFANINGTDAALPIVGVVRGFVNAGKAVKEMNDNMDGVVAKAERAEQIGNELADITKQEISNSVEISRLNADIAEYKRIATDQEASLEERTAAREAAEAAINRRMELQLPLARRRADLTKELHSLTRSTVEETREDANLEIQVNNLERERETELRSINRLSRTITTEAGKQNAEYLKQLEAIRAIKQSREDLKAWSVDTSAGKIDISYSLPPDGSLRDDVNAAMAAVEDAAKVKVKFQMPKPEMIDISYSLPSNESLRDDVNAATAAAEDAAKVKVKFQMPKAEMMTPVELPVKPEVDDNFQYLFDSNLGFATIHVGMELDQSKLHDISEQVQSVVEGLATSLSEDIGGLIGDLVTGGEAWGNFATAAMSSFADMAQAVGKMAISTGLATIGIKAALESLNGYVAIAAGAALVALGAAVKAGLKNVASGNYASAPTSVASGSYSSSSSSAVAGYNERELNVKVTGTLKASGSELVTVLNNENRRRLATT